MSDEAEAAQGAAPRVATKPIRDERMCGYCGADLSHDCRSDWRKVVTAEGVPPTTAAYRKGFVDGEVWAVHRAEAAQGAAPRAEGLRLYTQDELDEAVRDALDEAAYGDDR